MWLSRKTFAIAPELPSQWQTFWSCPENIGELATAHTCAFRRHDCVWPSHDNTGHVCGSWAGSTVGIPQQTVQQGWVGPWHKNAAANMTSQGYGTSRSPKMKHNKFLPGANIKLAPVDDTGEFKEHGEPAPHPHPILLTDHHLLVWVAYVLLEHLQQHTTNSKWPLLIVFGFMCQALHPEQFSNSCRESAAHIVSIETKAKVDRLCVDMCALNGSCPSPPPQV